jgi:hypothetical protein
VVVFRQEGVVHVGVCHVVIEFAEVGEGGTQGFFDEFNFVVRASTHCTKSLHVNEAIPAGVLELMIATLAGPRLLMIADCKSALALSHFSISDISFTNLENAFGEFEASGFWGTVIVGRGRIVVVV